jgi:hypothetical protein
VVGGYELLFEDATVRVGGFSGPVCPARPLCG